MATPTGRDRGVPTREQSRRVRTLGGRGGRGREIFAAVTGDGGRFHGRIKQCADYKMVKNFSSADVPNFPFLPPRPCPCRRMACMILHCAQPRKLAASQPVCIRQAIIKQCADDKLVKTLVALNCRYDSF